jgi:hypothetical protein
MAGDAQMAANIRNAAMSTGPRSTSGKTRSSRNALKHGLTAMTVMAVLPQQDARLLEMISSPEANDEKTPKNVRNEPNSELPQAPVGSEVQSFFAMPADAKRSQAGGAVEGLGLRAAQEERPQDPHRRPERG